jgi:hypothetical protein
MGWTDESCLKTGSLPKVKLEYMTFLFPDPSLCRAVGLDDIFIKSNASTAGMDLCTLPFVNAGIDENPQSASQR